MKRSLFAACILLAPAVSHGAMTCAQTSFAIMPFDIKPDTRRYTLGLTCTCDTTPGTAVATLGAEIMNNMDGKYGYTITIVPGGTAPTDNSDLAISDSRGLALLTAAGNGLNLVDATSTTEEYFEGPNGDHYPLFKAAYPLTITLTNNAVNNSSFVAYIDMVE